MLPVIRDLSEYNLWANETLAGFLTTIPRELFEREVESSFSSIRNTILHIANAEYIWVERLRGKSPDSLPSQDNPGTPKAVFQKLTAQSKRLQTYVNELDADLVHSPVSYTTTHGQRFVQPAYEILLHCFNHSTYHRGQLVVLARQCGTQGIPATDYIRFKRNGRP